MSSIEKEEVGKWLRDGASIYKLKENGYRHGKPVVQNDAYFRMQIHNQSFATQQERDDAESALAAEVLELIELGLQVKQSISVLKDK